MKRYWFVSEYFWPGQNATGYLITRIVDKFTEKYKANIITIGNYGYGERNKNTSTIRIKECDSLNKKVLLQRIIKLIIYSFKMIMIILGKNIKDDIVISVTSPAFIIVFLAIIKKIKKFKLIIIAYDIFPNNLIVAEIVNHHTMIYKLTDKIFNFSYNNSDLIISCGRDMQKALRQKVKYSNKIIFIPNFGDTDILFPEEKKNNKIVLKYQIKDKLVILFAGNIGRMQNIDNIIVAANILKDDNSIVFLFIGDGVFQEKVKQYSKINSNIILLPPMTRDKQMVFLNAGDIGLSSLLPNSNGVGVPSKTYSYMATGKPIIAFMDSDTEIAMMIKEEGNGWVIDPKKPNQLAELLIYLKNNPMEIKTRGEISYILSKTKYSIDNRINQYINKITDINRNEEEKAHENNQIKISIITVCYNSAATIRDTFESVLNQTYKNIDYIVVDGNSKDETISIIKEYEQKFGDKMRWVSEPDNGLYDAMNKGIRMAMGEVVGIINSDDFYHRSDIIEIIASSFIKNKSIQAVFGDIRFVKENNLNKTVRYFSSKTFIPWKFRFGFMPAHPTFFTYKENFDKFGYYKISYQITADFELLLRFLYVHKLEYNYIPLDFLKMRIGGLSTSSFKNRHTINKEFLQGCKENGIYTNIFLLSIRYFIKLFEILFKHSR
jgi:glycosyltransferase involved in cell wall biosynthesis